MPWWLVPGSLIIDCTSTIKLTKRGLMLLVSSTFHKSIPIPPKEKITRDSFTSFIMSEIQRPCFRTLPTELRLTIWRFTITPRLVEIKYWLNDREPDCYSTTQIPLALHVCRESRAEVEPFYSHSFGRGGNVLFNFDIDTLFISGLDFLHKWYGSRILLDLGESEFARLKYLAISEEVVEWQWNIDKMIASMKGLKRLTVVRDVTRPMMGQRLGYDSESYKRMQQVPITLLNGLQFDVKWSRSGLSWPKGLRRNLPNASERYGKGLGKDKSIEITAVFGWREVESVMV